MSAGVVDQLELIQIQIQKHMTGLRILPRVLNGGRQAILELPAIDQSGKRIVACLIVERPMQPALLADIVKHHDRADEVAGPVMDGSRRILNGNFLTAPIDQYGMLGKSQ